MTPEPDWTDEEESPLRLRVLLNWLLFGLRAVNRRRRLASTVAIGGIVVTLALFGMRSKEYEVEVRILTSPTDIIASLVNPRRAVSRAPDDVTRGAAEKIRSRQSRDRLIDATMLPEMIEDSRSPLGKLKRSVMQGLFGAADPKLVRASLLKQLDKNIEVSVIDRRVIVIRVLWADANVSTAIASAALDLFLKDERDRELEQINDTTKILDRTISRARVRLEETSDRLEALIREKETDLMRRTTRVRGDERIMSFRRPGSADESADVETPDPVIEEKQRELVRSERTWQRQLDRANDNLTRLRESLGPKHPDVRDAERTAAQAAVVPAELEALRRAVSALAVPKAAPQVAAARFKVVQVPLSEAAYAALSADPDVESLMTELRKYVTEYNELLDRRAEAELEIDMATTGFAHRYTVTQPPEVPLKPVASLTRFLRVAGIALSILLAFLVCVGLDLHSRRLFESFQIEEHLGIAVLGDHNDEA